MKPEAANYLQSQFAMYFKRTIDKPDIVWNTINNELNGLFDQTPIIIPVPTDTQLNEVPVVQVTSSNNLKLTISRSRLDFYVGSKNKNDKYINHKESIIKYSQYFTKLLGENISWIGFISNFFLESKNPAILISSILNENFRNLHPGQTLESTIDFISTVEVAGKKVNNHTQLIQGSAKYKGEDKESPGVVIIRDYNTKPEHNSNNYINEDYVKIFINYAQDNFLLDQIIKDIWII